MNEGLILEKLRKNLHKLPRITIIDYISLLLLLQLIRQAEVKASNVGNHRAAVCRLVATLRPGAPVRFNARVGALVNGEVLLGAEGLPATVEATPEGLHTQVNPLVGLEVSLGAEGLLTGGAGEGTRVMVLTVTTSINTTTTSITSSYTVISGFVGSKAVLGLEDSTATVHFAGVLAVEAVVVANRLNAQTGNVATARGGAREGA